MKVWLVLLVLGHVSGSMGPLTTERCAVLAAHDRTLLDRLFRSELHGSGVSIVARSRVLKRADLAVECRPR